MGWDIAVVGTLSIDAKARKRWRRLPPSFDIASPEGFPEPQKTCTGVGQLLDALSKDVLSICSMVAKGKTWSLRALFDNDTYLDWAGDLAGALAAAHTVGARGRVYFYGWITAGPGMAYALELGETTSFEKLTPAEEKAIAGDEEVKQMEAWLERRIGDLARSEIPRTSEEFFSGMEEVREILEELLAFLRSAPDEALLDRVQESGFHCLDPGKFKSARRIKNACRSNACLFDSPPFALQEMLVLAAKLDTQKTIELCRHAAQKGGMPRPLWEACCEVLGPTPHAPLVVEKMRLNSGYSMPFAQIEAFARWLSSPSVTPELLMRRFREEADKPVFQADYDVIKVMAATLSLRHRAWDLVQEIAAVRFEHPDMGVRTSLGEVLAKVDIPVPVNAPAIMSMVGQDATVDAFYEFERRLRTDPTGIYEELEPHLAAKHKEAIHLARWSLDKRMDRKLVLQILEREPRWKRYTRRRPERSRPE
ncbi:MAG: hypothetical protein JXR96_19280 [Deltaproteobacteria bacterium]|nr:hypothetical protein [Deltaproteobacteria bacterium]